MTSEEPATPDLAEIVRRGVASHTPGQIDAAMRFYRPAAIFDMSPMGMGTFEGRAAIRGFLEDWLGAYDESFEIEVQEFLELGRGVTFTVIRQSGRPLGSSGEIELRYAAVGVFADGLVERTTNYSNIVEARAAAEHLAQERG